MEEPTQLSENTFLMDSVFCCDKTYLTGGNKVTHLINEQLPYDNHIVEKRTNSLGVKTDKGHQRIQNRFETPNTDTVSTNENGGTQTETEETKESGLLKSSLKKKTILVLCSAALFISSCASSLIAPIYPPEALKKGMSLTIVGFVFCEFELFKFLVSPIIGTYITRIGVKFVFISGVFVGGSSSILFGILTKCPDGMWFTVMSILCRSVEAIGFASVINATMTIVSNEFKEHVGRAIAILQTSISVGYIVGPVIGGFLYDLGGFGLPFFSLGCCIWINGIVVYMLLPKSDQVKSKKWHKSIFHLFSSPMVVIPMFSVILASGGIIMFDSLYATHLTQFNLSATATGALYMTDSMAFTLSAPLWGYLADAKDIQGPLLISGQLVFGLSFILNGPSNLLPLLPFTLWTNVMCYVLMGVSFSILGIIGIKCMVKGAYELKFEETIETYGLVSGLYNSAFSFGGFIGPLAGAAVVERFGFPKGFATFGLMNLFFTFVLVGFFAYRYFLRRKNEIDSNNSTNEPRE